MQQQVAVDSFYRTELGQVATRATDFLEQLATSPGVGRFLRAWGFALDWSGKLGDVPRERVAFVLIQIQAVLFVGEIEGRPRLVVRGHLQPELHSACRFNEFLERRGLRLPTETPDTPVFQNGGTTLDLGELGNRPRGRRANDLGGYRFD